MNHVKTFESFEKIDEYFGQKFITGHGKGEKNNAKQKILKDIDMYIDEISSHPKDKNPWGHSDVNGLKKALMRAAEENNWKGHLEDRQSKHNDLWYVMYIPGTSGLENIASGLSAGTGMKKMGGY